MTLKQFRIIPNEVSFLRRHKGARSITRPPPFITANAALAEGQSLEQQWRLPDDCLEAASSNE